MVNRQYRVLVLSFINGALRGTGEIVELPEGIEAGSNLEAVTVSEAKKDLKSESENGGVPVNQAPDQSNGVADSGEAVAKYRVQHVGKGDFAVQDADGVSVSQVFEKGATGEAKAFAQAEADRMNGVTVPEVATGAVPEDGFPDA